MSLRSCIDHNSAPSRRISVIFRSTPVILMRRIRTDQEATKTDRSPDGDFDDQVRKSFANARPTTRLGQILTRDHYSLSRSSHHLPALGSAISNAKTMYTAREVQEMRFKGRHLAPKLHVSKIATRVPEHDRLTHTITTPQLTLTLTLTLTLALYLTLLSCSRQISTSQQHTRTHGT